MRWILGLILGLIAVPVWAYTGLTDSASHPPPSSGTYDYEAFTPAAGGFPALGATYVDPIFGSTITRLSAVATGNTGSSIQYQRRGQFNHDGTAWLHDTGGSGVQVINPATGAVLRAPSVPYPISNAEVTFVPAAGWETRYLYTSTTTLRSYDYVSTADVLVKDFGGGNTLGQTGGTGDIISSDGCLLVLHISTNLRVYNRCTDVLFTGSVTSPTSGTLNIPPGHAGITPDGSYLVIHGNPDNTGTQQGHVSYAINRTTQTLSTTAVMFWNGCQDHGALVTGTDGVSYLVTGNCYASTNRGIVAISVHVDRTGLTVDQQTAQGRVLFPVFESGMLGGINVGCAGRGVHQDWCAVSINSPTDSIGSPGTWYAYKSEIIMVQVVSPWQVVRVAHHRARSSADFCRNPRPTMNWDGTRVIFTSNMSSTRAPTSGCAYADTYMMEWPASLIAGGTVYRGCVLGWDANTEPDLAGYRIYTSQVQGSYTTYALQVGSAVTTASCAELGLTQGTYYIRTTAIDSATPPNESPASSEMSVDVRVPVRAR